MATTANIKKGLCINYNNDIYKIIDFLHVKPGKGSAFVRTKLKSLTNGKIIENTFSSGHKIKEVYIQNHKYQYLYNDNDGFYFMNHNDFSQIYLKKKLVHNSQWLKPGENVIITINTENESPLCIELPPNVILKIIEGESYTKGNTISNNPMKYVILETGARILVPLFIQTGEKIKIDTSSGTYIERVERIKK